MKSTPWVVVGGSSGELGHCTRCGVGLSMTGAQPLYLVAELMKAFTKHHSQCKDVGRKEPNPDRDNWFFGRDTGTSSYTIYYVLGHRQSPHGRYDTPSDPADFGRCYRLLELFPEWRERLPEVANRFPKWGPMVAHWDEMTALYEEEIKNPDGMAPKLYALMKTLENEGLIEEGWIQTGSGSWRKSSPTAPSGSVPPASTPALT